MKKVLVPALAAAVLLSLSGCASIISGTTQSVSIAPMSNGSIDSKVTCTATNKKGSWITTGGGTVTVKKAGEDLSVRCVNPDTNAVGMQNAPNSTQYGWAVANFLLWDLCTISCLIDFGTGSIYEYPTQVQVVMPAGPATAAAAPAAAQVETQAPAAAPAQLN